MEKVIGIDLGTTNSCVAIVENGTPVVIRSDGAVLQGFRPKAFLETWLKGASSGQAARALRRSAWVRGYFSTLMKCSRDPLPDRGACSRKTAIVARKLSPVPKPVSPITKLSLSWCENRAGR